MKRSICEVRGQEILDSRGWPTVQARVTLRGRERGHGFGAQRRVDGTV